MVFAILKIMLTSYAQNYIILTFLYNNKQHIHTNYNPNNIYNKNIANTR